MFIRTFSKEKTKQKRENQKVKATKKNVTNVYNE